MFKGILWREESEGEFEVFLILFGKLILYCFGDIVFIVFFRVFGVIKFVLYFIMVDLFFKEIITLFIYWSVDKVFLIFDIYDL